VVKQENANPVTCSCLPATTVIDSKTGHTKLVCKKMKAEKSGKMKSGLGQLLFLLKVFAML
jgi:hypothetical protein